MSRRIAWIRWLVGGSLLSLWAQKVCPVDKAFLRGPLSPMQTQAKAKDTLDTLWVPVVFHLIASDSAGWLPAYRIGDQLRALNRDFRPARIQFYLPRFGPGGGPTCGVTWTLSPLAQHDWTYQEDTLKKLLYWPTDSFLNIWVVESMTLNTIGYARALGDTVGMPGMVLVTSVVGDQRDMQAPFDRGRTAVHEMGHVFSLYHPFEGGCVGTTPQTCASEGDEICDTPPQRNPTYGCPTPIPNTCTETPQDLPDPIHNLMGYVDDSCMYEFTSLQIDRMRAFLSTFGAALISPENAQARGRQALVSEDCAAITALSPSPEPSGFRVRRFPWGIAIEGEQNCGYRLYDVWGRLCHWSSSCEVPMEGLPAGIYLLQVGPHTAPRYMRFLWP